MERVRQKRIEYLERVREHEGSITGMRSHMDRSPTDTKVTPTTTTALSEEAIKLKWSTLELLQSSVPFFTSAQQQTSPTPLTSTPIKKA